MSTRLWGNNNMFDGKKEQILPLLSQKHDLDCLLHHGESPRLHLRHHRCRCRFRCAVGCCTVQK